MTNCFHFLFQPTLFMINERVMMQGSCQVHNIYKCFSATEYDLFFYRLQYSANEKR